MLKNKGVLNAMYLVALNKAMIMSAPKKKKHTFIKRKKNGNVCNCHVHFVTDRYFALEILLKGTSRRERILQF